MKYYHFNLHISNAVSDRLVENCDIQDPERVDYSKNDAICPETRQARQPAPVSIYFMR